MDVAAAHDPTDRFHAEAGAEASADTLPVGAGPVTVSLDGELPPAPSPADVGLPPSPGGRVFADGEVVSGRYRIGRLLGRGGMGEVYRADDLELHETIALKTLRADGASDEKAIAHLRREVQLARRVTHPNVCRLFDVGFATRRSPDGGGSSARVPFLTMELLAGEPLASRIRSGRRMRAEEALPLVRQMGAALEAAHAAGVVHRDFKSDNVLLVTPPGGETRAVVTDFGVAHFLAGRGGMPSLRSGHAVVGTPAYMAPEQVLGKAVTEATDVYAFGVVLYEMVTGELPFVGRTPWETAALRLERDAPPVWERAPDLDARWRRTIARCLERSPGRRFTRISDAVAALSPDERADGAPRSRRTVAVALAGALAVATAALVLGSARGRAMIAGMRGGSAGIPLPSRPEARRSLLAALAAERRIDLPAAAELLDAAATAEPGEPILHAALAEVRTELCLPAAARESAARAAALALAPGHGVDPRARLYVEARVAAAGGEWQRAAGLAQALVGLAPDDLDAGLYLAGLEVRAGAARDALVTVEALRRLPAPAREDPRIDLAAAAAAEALSDGRRELDAASQALARADVRAAPLLVARARLAEAWGAITLGDAARALGAASEARRLAALGRDRALEARAQNAIGAARGIAGERAPAAEAFRAALALRRALGDRAGEAAVLNNLGDLYTDGNELPAALSAYDQVLAIDRASGDRAGAATTLGNLGLVYERAGELAHALASYQEALTAYRALGDEAQRAWMTNHVARLELVGGRVEEARRLREEALAAARRVGNPAAEADALSGLGGIARVRDDGAAARARFAEALSVRERSHATRGAWRLRGVLAEVALDGGAAAEAARAAEEVAQWFARTGGAGAGGADAAAAWELVARARLAGGDAQGAAAAVAAAEHAVPESGLAWEARLRLDATTAAITVAAPRTTRASRAGVAGAAAGARGAAPESIVGGAAHHGVLGAVAPEGEEGGAGGGALEGGSGVARLASLAERARAAGQRRLAAEIELARGAALLSLGRSSEARAVLSALERTAGADGFLHVAHRAAAQREGHR